MRNKILKILVLVLITCSFTSDKLNILIIGDSISMGYTPYVKKGMVDKANITHNPGNAQYTAYGLENLEEWLGNTEWDIIYFNFGLHDLCYRDRSKSGMASRDKIGGELETPLKEYEKNLNSIVKRLKKTGARIIFATTTYVPENEPGRFKEDVAKYNKIAVKVMKKNKIEINDLYSLSEKLFPIYGNGSRDVHYKSDGYKEFAKEIIGVLTEK